jgi:hypothetical protein
VLIISLLRFLSNSENLSVLFLNSFIAFVILLGSSYFIGCKLKIMTFV